MKQKVDIKRIAEPNMYRIASLFDGCESIAVTAVGLLEISSWVDGHRVQLQCEAAEELAADQKFSQEEIEEEHNRQRAWDEYKDLLGRDIDP